MGLSVAITKKRFFVILGVLLILAGIITVYAYKSGGPPSVFGHSAEEIEVQLSGGQTTNLQTFVTNINQYVSSGVSSVQGASGSGISTNPSTGNVLLYTNGLQKRVSTSCQSGYAMVSIDSAGVPTCTPITCPATLPSTAPTIVWCNYNGCSVNCPTGSTRVSGCISAGSGGCSVSSNGLTSCSNPPCAVGCI